MSSFLNPEGNSTAKIAFVVDAPKDKDAFEGQYLAGWAGQVFDALLGSQGITRHSTYRTALIKTPLNAYGYSKYISKGHINYSPEYRAWVEYLRRELTRTDANVIVPMGELAFHALTGLRMHSKFRGSIVPCTLIPGRKVIACLHPSIMQAQYHLKPFIQCDLAKIGREMNDRIIIQEDENFFIEPSFDIMMDVLKDIEKNASILSWDIETAGQAISCIGFSTDKINGICCPLTIPGQQRYWSNPQERILHKQLQRVLQAPNYPKGGQNINYDVCWMIKTMNIVPKEILWDTMVASHSCYSELKKDLGTLTSLHTNYPYYKDEGNVWKEGVRASSGMTQKEKLHQYWRYNAKDCHRTLHVWHSLEKEMKEMNVTPVHDFVVQKYLPLAVYMTCRGMLYNIEEQAKMYAEYSIVIDEVKTSMVENFNLPEGFNIGSPKQVGELMYDIWGMKEKKNRAKAGKPASRTVDDKALVSLKREYPKHIKFLSSLQKFRAKKKLQSTYLGLHTSEFDGRIHFGYNIVGTETGRWSSSTSCFGDGTNGQNIPDKTRHLIYAPEGTTFINADLSQAEARIVGMLGKETALLELFASGQDVHAMNAQRIFHITAAEVLDIFSGDKSYRDIGKKVVHASNYNMSARTFAIQTQIPVAQANKALAGYFAMYPGIPRYHSWVENEVRNKGILTTIYGRKRIFFGRRDANTFREAYAMIPQSTVGDILNHGAYAVFIDPKLSHLKLVLQVHDSIMVECPDELVEMSMPLMKEHMEIEIHINGLTHVIPVDFQTGKVWGKRKELADGTIVNPNGMIELK